MGTKRRAGVCFVVPFFLDGHIDQVRVYSDVMKAQAALRRYVRYSELLAEAREKRPNVGRREARLDAYGAIERTAFAGTEVYEVEIDSG